MACVVQEQLVVALAVQGEVALAETYCTQFGLDPGSLPLQGDALQQASPIAGTSPASDHIFLAIPCLLETRQSYRPGSCGTVCVQNADPYLCLVPDFCPAH